MISYELRIILVFFVTFFATIFILPNLSHIALRLGLLDQPNARKVHTRPRPLVGGIGMVMAVTFTSLVFIPIQGLRGYFLGLAILVFVGFLDDFREIGHQQKFLAQIVASAVMIYFSNAVLSSFGDIFSIGELQIPGGRYVIWLVTVFSVVGVVNAVNLIDGLDGLAGGISFVAFIFFAVHASLSDNHVLMLLSLAFAGAILGFLQFNWYPSVLFMGDAGSLCLGFSLAFMSLALTQGSGSSVSPVAALLILAVPVTDTIIVMFKRIIRRKNPFYADKYHLHHIFLRYGFGREGAVRMIIGLSVMMGCLSLLQPIYGFSDAAVFSMFTVYFALYLTASFYIIGFLRYSVRLRRKRAGKYSANNLVCMIFGAFDVFRIFRKSSRFSVDLGLKIAQPENGMLCGGRVLNISSTGCMIRLKGEAEIPQGVLLEIDVSCKMRLRSISVLAEHLWGANIDGLCFHGFRFTSFMSADDEECFIEFMQQLAHNGQAEQQMAA